MVSIPVVPGVDSSGFIRIYKELCRFTESRFICHSSGIVSVHGIAHQELHGHRAPCLRVGIFKSVSDFFPATRNQNWDHVVKSLGKRCPPFMARAEGCWYNCWETRKRVPTVGARAKRFPAVLASCQCPLRQKC